jgi:hypothetical protein
MKKIYLLALMCLTFIQLKAQDGVTFKIKFMPNRNYKTDISMNMKLNAAVTGDPAILDKLKSSGITPPITALFDFGMGGIMQSGAAGSDGSFPLNIDYKFNKLSVSVNGQEAPIPPSISDKDIKVSAHVGSDGIMMIDSAAGKKVDDTSRNKMKQMMNLFQKQIQFPAKGMKPGDSFTQTMPMNLPIGKQMGGDVKINYSTTYKLISISDGKAYFDVVPNFSMDFNIQNKMSFSISGTGLGKMVYSIKDNFPVSNSGNFTMKIKVKSDKVNVDADGTVTTNSTTTIN